MKPVVAIQIACVAWRFCQAGRTRGEASRFFCPRPPLLLSAPNQNRHATQATIRNVGCFLEASVKAAQLLNIP